MAIIPEFYTAQSVIKALKSGVYDSVIVNCLNKEEVNLIKAYIPVEYQSRVGFTWLTWEEKHATIRSN